MKITSNFLDTILNNIHVCVWVTELLENGDFVWTYNNPADQRLTGLDLCQPGGVKFEQALPPEQAEFNRQRCLEVVEQGQPVTFEDQFVVSGETRWSWNTLIPVRDKQGATRLIIGTGIDVTQLKQTEQQLRETQEQLVKVFNTPLIGIAISREGDGIYLDVNPGMLEITGYQREELVGRSSLELGFVSAAMRQKLVSDLKTQAGYLRHRELTLKTKQGDWRTILFSLESITLNGEACLLAVLVDVTDQRQTNRTLKEQEGLLQAMIENLPFDFFVRDRAGQLIRQSRQPVIRHRPGSSLEEAQVDETTRLEWRENHQRVLAGETIKGENVYDIDGEARHYYELMVPIYVEREIQGVLGFSIDITERKRIEQALEKYQEHLEDMVQQRTLDLARTNARLRQEIAERQRVEHALRDSEARLSLALSAGNHGFWDWNVATGELYMDLRWHQIMGYAIGELEPHIRTLEAICHPDDFPQVKTQIKAQLEGTATTFYEVEHRFLTRAGAWKWIYARGQVVNRNEHGYALRMIGTATDITERKLTEAQLKNSLAEKEILLKEIHHRVKNNLQIVSSLLYLQATNVKDDTIRRVFEESQARVRSMAFIHEQLYRSKDLAQVDMGVYAQDLVRHLREVYKANHIRLNIECGAVKLTIDQAIPCGLIINELVSNAMKYAFPPGVDRPEPASKEIRITLRQIDNQTILTVSDNGVGLPQNWDMDQVSSLGLILVTTLVRQLKGQLAWSNQSGAAFEITFQTK